MQTPLLLAVSKRFDTLVPQNQESILLLISLQQKIENREIEDPFTQREFEETVDEVGRLLGREQAIQKETIAKRLSEYFYTTLKTGSEYRFQLTVFAKDLVQLILDEINPEFENVELVHTFKRTMSLTPEDLKSIENFEYWFKNHFQSGKRRILSHTEGLHRYVNDRVLELRTLLKPNVENPKQLIQDFVLVFEKLGRQTEGLTQTLNFKQELTDKIKEADTLFSQNQKAWEKYYRIRYEVEQFFENIDSRVLSINDRILLATSRLRTLYDNLRYKQVFKLKLEKLLLFLLKYSINNKGEVLLPEGVQKKKIPYVKGKLLSVPLLDFGHFIPRDRPDFEEDADYKRIKEQENTGFLTRQEHISKWLEEINKEVSEGSAVNFSDWFKKIAASEKNLEVPLEVCFGLIQRHNNNPSSNLFIERSITINDKDVALWNMKIQPSLS